MVRKTALASLCVLLLSGTAWAEQDFYGIQFKTEKWARALVLNEPSPDPAELSEGPVLSQTIRAEAALKEIEDRHIAFQVTVFNDTNAPIKTDYNLRDFFVYTREGKKYSLIDTQEDLPPFIDPRTKLSFTPSFGNLALKNSDVQMIVCSFDLGKTKIMLFPWSKKDIVNKLVSPPPPPKPVKEEKKRRSKAIEPKEGPYKKTPKRNFWEWLGPEQKKPVIPTAVEASSKNAPSLPEDTVAPATQQTLDSAIQNFVYKPNGGSVSAVQGKEPLVRTEAHVIDFNKPYNFITLDLGEQDGLKKGMALSIVRDGKLVAKARVRQLRPTFAAAVVEPGSTRSEIRVGDTVAFV